MFGHVEKTEDEYWDRISKYTNRVLGTLSTIAWGYWGEKRIKEAYNWVMGYEQDIPKMEKELILEFIKNREIEGK